MPIAKQLATLAVSGLLLTAWFAGCGDDGSSSVPSGAGAGTTASTSAGTGGAAGAGGAPAPTPAQILAADWVELSQAPSIMGKQDDVYFIDDNDGWSINGLGQIFQTQDGGNTWNKLLDQPGTYFRAVTFLDALHGFAANLGTGPGVTDVHPLYETTNGGKTWAPIKSFQGTMPAGICNFNKIDATHIIGTGRVGGPSFFTQSNDGGKTWTSSPIDADIAMLVDSRFTTPEDGLVTGGSSLESDSHCVILHTADAGKSWKTVFTSKEAGEMCWKFSFPSDQVGYASVLTFTAGSTPSTFLKTTDGGKTWQEKPFLKDSYAALGVGFITEDIGWLGGEATGKPVYRTKDGGESWQPDPSLGPYINRFRFVDPRTAYAIGSSIYKLEIP